VREERGFHASEHQTAIPVQLLARRRDEYLLGAVEADWRFHEALVLASQNQRLAIAYRHSPMLIIHPDVLAGKEWEQTMRRTVDEHRAVLAALLEGSAVKAKETLRMHIRDRRRPSVKSAAV